MSVFSTPHSVEFTKFLYHLRIISWNQFYSKLFTKQVIFTEIFQNFVIQKYRKLHSVTLHCGNSRNFLVPLFVQIFNFFVKSTQQTFPLVKMAKIELQDHNFRHFRAKLRRPKLNQSCRGGFKLWKSVEFAGDGEGCSKLSIVEYSATLGAIFI